MRKSELQVKNAELGWQMYFVIYLSFQLVRTSIHSETIAKASYPQAQEIYARIGNEQGLANAILGLGTVYRVQHKYAEAEELYTRAQEIYNRVGNGLGRANTLHGLGQVNREQGRRMEAASFYAQARDLYSQSPDRRL
ncbi:hypothetical protein M407DRAFT_29854 [Tulasnella calospora MUT 4182]|uniref:MalT-like TPR region domain-containing protein n=1 Tax=Tulasnella calospora MUT 4182 TaxID=1051891 RepID=A0A0C3LGB1_9AGAM|nr:hypothetical protein M407DRAFT_29854 [Tulasnella calospora MUT 4182]